MAQRGETNLTPVPADSSPDWRALLNNRWIVLAGLFLVTGALGIPFLWIGRAFSTRMKILLSIVVTLYTALLLWLFWLIMLWSYHRISEVDFGQVSADVRVGKDLSRVLGAEFFVGRCQRIDVDEDQQAHACELSHAGDGRSTAVTGQCGVFFPAIREIAFVNQHIDTLDMRDVAGVVFGRRVGDVSE